MASFNAENQAFAGKERERESREHLFGSNLQKIASLLCQMSPKESDESPMMGIDRL